MQGDDGPSATINQVWDQYGDWRGGDDTQAAPSQIVYNVPTPFTFRPKFDVPITGHSISFLVSSVTVAERNPATGTYTTKTYTSSKVNMIGQMPGPNMKSDLSGYASFSPESATDTQGAGTPTVTHDGVYKSAITIPYNPDKIVQSVTFVAMDDGVCYGVLYMA